DGGPATETSFSFQPPGGGGPNGLTVDAAGNVYIADRYSNRIRKVDAKGIITNYAGGGTAFVGPALSVNILQPVGIRFDNSGNLYVATAFGSVERVGAGGSVSIIQAANLATGVAPDAAGNVYTANQLAGRIQKIVGTSVIPVAGTGKSEFSGDGGA